MDQSYPGKLSVWEGWAASPETPIELERTLQLQAACGELADELLCDVRLELAPVAPLPQRIAHDAVKDLVINVAEVHRRDVFFFALEQLQVIAGEVPERARGEGSPSCAGGSRRSGSNR